MVQKKARAVETRRGSPEAIEKRRAARAFNDVLTRGAGTKADGRTERRRRRLLSELEGRAARGGRKELKPIDVLLRVQELLDLGEPLASIKKACPPPRALEPTDALLDGVRRIHAAYRFALEAYRFVGIGPETLRAAGVDAAKPGLAGARRDATKRGRVA